jgi:hypothetical protein
MFVTPIYGPAKLQKVVSAVQDQKQHIAYLSVSSYVYDTSLWPCKASKVVSAVQDQKHTVLMVMWPIIGGSMHEMLM